MTKRDLIAAAALLAVGLLQMLGAASGNRSLQGLGSALGASPHPKVFSAVQGWETYSARFSLHWRDLQGRPRSLALTPELGARLQGPYNRRNMYGAALAYGPVLSRDTTTQPMFDAISSYGLCQPAPVLRELGIDPDEIATDSLEVRFVPARADDAPELPRTLQLDCL